MDKLNDRKIMRSAGFSTLEILIAMTVLVMVLSAIILVTFGNQSLFIDSETNSEALNKAQEILEQEQALGRKDFKLVNPVSATTDGIYQKSVSATNTDYHTKQVTSSVTWFGDHNRSHRIDLTSLVTNFENVVGGDTCFSILSGDWTKPQIKSSTNLASLISNDLSGSYPITDLNVHQKKLYVTVNGTSQTVGPNSPTATSNDNSIGTISWNQTSGVLASGGSIASATFSSGSIKTSNYLKATGFGPGLNIPIGATILGIKVDVWRRASNSGAIIDNQVRLIKSNGTLSSVNKAMGSTWSSSIVNTTYGNSSDLWGEKWSATDINSGNFGVAFSATENSGSATRTANIDFITVTVTYVKQFYVIDVANSLSPTLVTGLANNSISPAVSTGIQSIAVATSSNYSFAYLATKSGPASGQLEVIDMNSIPYTATSTYKVAGVTGSGTQAIGNSIFYKDGYVYLGLTKTATGPEFNIIDVHSPNNPVLVGSASIGNDINAIYVKNNYAYVASPNTNDLLVFDVGVSKLSPTMSPIANFNGTNGLHGKSVYVVGDTVYLGRTFGTNELYVLDASTTPIMDLGHIDTGSTSGDSVNSLIVRNYLTFTLNTAGKFQIWKTDNPTSISLYNPLFPISVPSVAGNNTPLDCEGNTFYVGSTDSSSKGYISIISTP